MKIVVLAGGTSTERDVSFSSGRKVFGALKENGHDVILLDVYLGYELSDEEKSAPLGALFTSNKDWIKDLGTISAQNPDIEQIKALRPDGDRYFFGPNVIELCQEADVVFMALHGENGENGKIQACFDLLGIKYTGTDYLSSAIAMNKAIAKDIFRAHGIPTPHGTELSRKQYEMGLTNVEISFPLIVKACCGGSSVGCAIARTAEDYAEALKEAFKYDDTVVIEQYIMGREFSIAVMDGRAMPIIEIAPKEGFYDYKNKYQPGATVETCPANLDETATKKMQQCAERIFEVLRLRNYARIDFMMDGATGEFFALEANTLPGMTPTSLVPQEALAMGIGFNELCQRIVQSAV